MVMTFLAAAMAEDMRRNKRDKAALQQELATPTSTLPVPIHPPLPLHPPLTPTTLPLPLPPYP